MSNSKNAPHTRLQVLPTEEYFSRVRKDLAQNGQAYVRVTGTSMTPLLHHVRDGVVLVPPKRIRSGDIVLFSRENGRYALHRVIRIKGDRFTMAGDHQWHIETGLPAKQIVGVAAMLHRRGKFISCKKFSIKIYSACVTLLTFPRIYIRRAMRFMIRPFRKPKSAA